MSNEHFNWIARFYNHAAVFEVTRDQLEYLDLPCVGLFLDVGGGTGRAVEALASYLERSVVTDVSAGMLHYAQIKGFDCVLAPAEELPFENDTFERIFMMDVFHHVRDQVLVLRDLVRVLKPGGRLVIVEPNIHLFSVKLIAVAERLLLMRSHFYSGEQIVELLSCYPLEVQVKADRHNTWVIAQK